MLFRSTLECLNPLPQPSIGRFEAGDDDVDAGLELLVLELLDGLVEPADGRVHDAHLLLGLLRQAVDEALQSCDVAELVDKARVRSGRAVVRLEGVHLSEETYLFHEVAVGLCEALLD